MSAALVLTASLLLVFPRESMQFTMDTPRSTVSFGNLSYTSACAAFEPQLEVPFTGIVVPALPLDGCQLLTSPSVQQPWIALIKRGNCSFVQKIRNAELAGASAVVVYNALDDSIVKMGSAHGHPGLTIPSQFVAASTGLRLLAAHNNTGSSLQVTLSDCPSGSYPDISIASQYMTLLAALMVFLCTIILAGWIRQHWLRSRDPQQLTTPAPAQLVINLPQRIGQANEDQDCVICLEELGEGDMIRMLPCGHQYHSGCIDRWLQTQQRQCPMCKRDVTHANAQAAPMVEPAPTGRHRWCCFGAGSAQAEEHAAAVEFELVPEVLVEEPVVQVLESEPEQGSHSEQDKVEPDTAETEDGEALSEHSRI